jgi:hypothetical protein
MPDPTDPSDPMYRDNSSASRGSRFTQLEAAAAAQLRKSLGGAGPQVNRRSIATYNLVVGVAMALGTNGRPRYLVQVADSMEPEPTRVVGGWYEVERQVWKDALEQISDCDCGSEGR